MGESEKGALLRGGGNRFSVPLSEGAAVLVSGTKTGRRVGVEVVGRRVGVRVTFRAVGDGVVGSLEGGSVLSTYIY